MDYNKQKYKKLIMESPLFTLDKEHAHSAYKRESYKMIEYLYCYLMAVSEMDYEQYACEIMKVSTRCIANFDSSKGVFLHYFNAAWKQEYSHLMGEKIVEAKLRGIKVTEEEKRNIRKYIKFVESKNPNLINDELFKSIADAMQLPTEKVRLIAELSNLHVTGDTLVNDDGEDVSVWEQFSNGTSIEDE